MSEWIYKGVELTEAPEAHSFIYEIKVIDMHGKLIGSYIGKKLFYTTRKKWFGKRKLAEMTDKRVKKYEYIKKESNWRKYCSSSEKIESLVKEGHKIERTILKLCYSSKQATYEENKALYECFESPLNLNENISGVIFKDEINRWKQ